MVHSINRGPAGEEGGAAAVYYKAPPVRTREEIQLPKGFQVSSVRITPIEVQQQFNSVGN